MNKKIKEFFKTNEDELCLMGTITFFVLFALFAVWCKNHDTNPILFICACFIKLWEFLTNLL